MSTHPQDPEIIEGNEVPAGTMALDALTRSEITMQQAYAREHPRSLSNFKKRALEMVQLDEDTAKECFYSLPRNEKGEDGEYTKKMLTGPSARLAEIVASAWGNCRATARVVGEDETGEFIRAQGAFHDLESNYAVCFEVRRRITTAKGKKFTADMVQVTGNAAASIAFRNAAFKGVPKALWNIMYKAAMKTAVGDLKTLSTKRSIILDTLNKMGIPNEVLFGILAIEGKDDIMADQLIELTGLETAIREGDTSVDDVLATWARQRLEANTQDPKPGMFTKAADKLKDAMERAKQSPQPRPAEAAATPSMSELTAEEKLKQDIAKAQEALDSLRAQSGASPKTQPPATTAAAAPEDSAAQEKSSPTPELQPNGAAEAPMAAAASVEQPTLSPSLADVFGKGHKPRRGGQ